MHTDRLVFNLTHTLIVGWPCTFTLTGTPSYDMLATRFYINSPPVEGFLEIQRCTSTFHESIDFAGPLSLVTVAQLPGAPIDPCKWMHMGIYAEITPWRIGPSYRRGIKPDVNLRIRYHGLIPPGVKPGSKQRLTIMFIGVAEEMG